MYSRKVKYALVLLIFLTQGCANGLVSQVKSDEQEIVRLKTSIQNLKGELSRSESFDGAQCVYPPYGPRPDVVCDSKETTRSHALSYCSIATGCSAAMLVIKDNFGSFEEKWAKTEACSQGIRALTNKGYSADLTVYNAFSAAVDVGCESEKQGFWNGLIKGASCLAAYTIAAERASAFINCVSRAESACRRKQEVWESAPKNKKDECQSDLDELSVTSRRIDELESSIRQKKSTLSWKIFGES